MTDTLPDNIDLDDENLDFSDEVVISPDDDIPEMKIPVLDDFINYTPIFGKFIGRSLCNVIDSIGLFMYTGLFCPPVNHEKEKAKSQKQFIKDQVRAMVPHIVRFQYRHLWDKNEHDQLIRNQHNLVRDRKIKRHWKTNK